MNENVEDSAYAILIDDIEVQENESLSIKSGKDIVLNLNGHDISGSSSVEDMYKEYAMITNEGKLTLVDTADSKGKITYRHNHGFTYGYLMPIDNWGTLIIDGAVVDVDKDSEWTFFNCAINTRIGSELIVNSGKVISQSGPGILLEGSGSSTEECKVTINGGIVEGSDPITIYFSDPCANNMSLTITGGKIMLPLTDEDDVDDDNVDGDATFILASTSTTSLENLRCNITGGIIG